MGADEKRPILTKMMDAIKHRGPDSGGQVVDENVAIGMRRLSIIDVHEGKQPIFNEDNQRSSHLTVKFITSKNSVMNLLLPDTKFTTHTDTEVILHGYEEYGTDILKKLRGMFAFVIYDFKTKELLVRVIHSESSHFITLKWVIPSCMVLKSRVLASPRLQEGT